MKSYPFRGILNFSPILIIVQNLIETFFYVQQKHTKGDTLSDKTGFVGFTSWLTYENVSEITNNIHFSNKDIRVREKKQYNKIETNIPRKGIARPKSQFPHSCVCERFIYSHGRSASSDAGNMWTDTGNIFINRSHTCI